MTDEGEYCKINGRKSTLQTEDMKRMYAVINHPSKRNIHMHLLNLTKLMKVLLKIKTYRRTYLCNSIRLYNLYFEEWHFYPDDEPLLQAKLQNLEQIEEPTAEQISQVVFFLEILNKLDELKRTWMELDTEEARYTNMLEILTKEKQRYQIILQSDD